MKRLIKYFGLLLFWIGMLFSFNKKAFARIDYRITDVKTTAKVQKDGSLLMKQRISYYFESPKHGVYYVQKLNKNQRLLNPVVTLYSNHQKQKLVQNNSGKNNTYQINTKDGYRFKIFHQIEPKDRVTAVIDYKITNAIKNWQDVAELNFKIIGDNWDKDLDDAQAEVIFNGPVKNLKAWAHGPSNGKIQVLPKNGKLIMASTSVNKNRGIEIHAMFDKSVTADNKNVSNQKRKAFIINQERQIAKKEQFRFHLAIVLTCLSIIFSMLCLIFSFYHRKYGVKPKLGLAHNYEIPPVDPVLAQVIDIQNSPDKNALVAYLMQLAGQKKLQISDFKQGKLHKKKYYKLTASGDLTNFDPFVRFLFEKVGDGDSFTTYDLKKYHDPDRLAEKFETWQADYKEQATTDGYFDETVTEDRENRGFWSIVLAVISLAFFVLPLFTSLPNPPLWLIWSAIGTWLLCCLVVPIFKYLTVETYTEKGARVSEQIDGFKQMLQDIGNFKMRDVGDIILWEEIMPYAVSFGLAKKVLKHLQLEFSENELADAGFYYSVGFYSSGENGFINNFNQNFDKGIATSSSSGGSGSFSSGSSGGFGSGSGGGAF